MLISLLLPSSPSLFPFIPSSLSLFPLLAFLSSFPPSLLPSSIPFSPFPLPFLLPSFPPSFLPSFLPTFLPLFPLPASFPSFFLPPFLPSFFPLSPRPVFPSFFPSSLLPSSRRSLLPSFFPSPSSPSSSLHLSFFPSSLPFSPIFVQLSVCENFHSPVPSDGPSFVRGYPLNSTAIHISWERIPSTSHNGKLLGYRIRYGRHGFQLYTEKNVTSNSTEVVISRLDFQTSYEIKVNGFNEVGHGPPGNLITVQTLQNGK